MDLIITEKDTVARDCVRALTGKTASGRWPYTACGYTFIPAQGHLLEMCEPEEVDPRFADRHDMELLPIKVGADWPKRPTSEFAERRIEALADELEKIDGIVFCAGDADDEGQLIVDELLEYLGYDPTSERFMRVFINDNLDENIKRAFDEAVPNSCHVGSGRGALARQLADFSFGINESRLASHLMGERADIGRVQTPTLGLVCARDASIESHAKREYFTLGVRIATKDGRSFEFTFKPESELCEDGRHIFQRSLLDAIEQRVREATIPSFAITGQRKLKEPPLPFNMTTLSAEASSKYKLTGTQTMEASQALRDIHHAITYNRSSSSYLKEEHFEEAPRTCGHVLENLGWDMPLSFEQKRPTFDDAKVAGHHGIIPQAIDVDVLRMKEQERGLYTLIAERYLAQFLPPIAYMRFSASLSIDGIEGIFELKVDVLEDFGYAAYVLKEDARPYQGKVMEACSIRGEEIASVDTQITPHSTTPPKRYTDGTLMMDMSRAAKFVHDPEMKRALMLKDEATPDEHGSIGTAATRASIIDSLVEKGYLKRKGNHLISTAEGRSLFRAIPHDSKGIDLTAKWYLMQQDVASGKAGIDIIARSAEEGTRRHKSEKAYAGLTLSPAIGTCPQCGDRIVSRGNSYTCITNKFKKGPSSFELAEGCGFSFPALYRKKRITPKQASSLILGKTVALKVPGTRSQTSIRLIDGKLEEDISPSTASRRTRRKR